MNAVSTRHAPYSVDTTDGWLEAPAPGSHVCWTVDDGADYLAGAEAFLTTAPRANEKPVLFGPTGSSDIEKLAPLAALTADPYVAVLGRRQIEPEAMFAAFTRETERARAEGYAGLRVMADMDWLLPTGADRASIESFEMMLDRHANKLDLTIVCAYRSASFDAATIRATACVHPAVAGPAQPPFQMVAGDGCWTLRGEVDGSVNDEFAVALTTAARTATPTAAPNRACVLDVAGLQFIDARNMARLGQLACTQPVELRGASATLQRHLRLACTPAEVARITFTG